ncbi:MAG: VWA domain-containing protein [Actinomycetota bacterium]|nr:VWA domain-containing protein [Actinomycetota bacterium]
MPRPEDAVLDAVVALGRGLRESGLRVSVDEEMVLCRALGEVDMRRKDQVYWAAQSALVHGPDDIPPFNAVFTRFWAGLAPVEAEIVPEHGETDPRMPGPQHGGENLPQFRQDTQPSESNAGDASRTSREIPTGGQETGQQGPERERGALAAYSPEEVVAEVERLEYARDELSAVRQLADELRAAIPERRSRRLRPDRRHGRLDVRRTIKRSMRTEGEPLSPALVSPSRRPRRLVVICDVSGSMERYSRALLAALGGVVGSGLKAETFVFATRLTRLTGALAGHDSARSLEAARAAVSDWSGGTRIGQALKEFNRSYGRRGLCRGAIVVVVSDGWDRGHADVLAREVQRMQSQARRLIWLNPRPTEIQGQPLAMGMRAALPFIDDFVPGHDPRAMTHLAQLIGGLGAGRPARRQRPPQVAAGR